HDRAAFDAAPGSADDGRIRLSQLRDAGMGRFSRACPYTKSDRAEAQRRNEARGAQARRAATPADGGHGNAAGLRARASERLHPQRRGALDAIGGGGRTREASGRLHGAVSRDHRRCLACANDQDGLPPKPMRRYGTERKWNSVSSITSTAVAVRLRTITRIA